MNRPFTIYFPQFYPTPTNDQAWGKGFSDWTLLGGHNARLPSSDRRAPARGLYDGSDRNVHRAQIAEMRSAGIGGMGLYHYWFFTHQELAAVEQGLLGDAGQGFPWFLIWATEGWTKRWLGDPTQILELSADPDDAAIQAHCAHLARCFSHPDYHRHEGRPLFVWYNLRHFDRPRQIVERYRHALSALGHDVCMANFIKNEADVPDCVFMDATYVFEPRMFFNFGRSDRGRLARRLFETTRATLGSRIADSLVVGLERARGQGVRNFAADAFVDYMRSPERARLLAAIPHGYQDVVSPGWDNRPRYGSSAYTALAPLTPDQFARLLADACARSGLPPLINAWNEWTELAAIEPCAYLGRPYLDAIAAFDGIDATG